MTRNIFLGADLGPALDADDPGEFVEANGEIFREVTKTDFPRRAHILAEEIEDAQPDIVGLQEVALWREGPPDIGPALSGVPVATEVRYDFLNLLLDALNQGVYDEYGEGYEEGSYSLSSSRRSSTSRLLRTRTASRTMAPPSSRTRRSTAA